MSSRSILNKIKTFMNHNSISSLFSNILKRFLISYCVCLQCADQRIDAVAQRILRCLCGRRKRRRRKLRWRRGWRLEYRRRCHALQKGVQLLQRQGIVQRFQRSYRRHTTNSFQNQSLWFGLELKRRVLIGMKIWLLYVSVVNSLRLIQIRGGKKRNSEQITRVHFKIKIFSLKNYALYAFCVIGMEINGGTKFYR